MVNLRNGKVFLLPVRNFAIVTHTACLMRCLPFRSAITARTIAAEDSMDGFIPTHPAQPHISRRTAVQAGAIGLLGLGMNHVEALRAMAAAGATVKAPPAKAVIYIFLSGGLAQHDSFDMKPDAPEAIRGEFKPIATRTPGIQICEHLPLLAQRSQHWALVRSLSHGKPDHSSGHMLMLSGRSLVPPAFSLTAPKPTDWPSIAAVAGT